jgi:hypothetical protein
MSVSARPFRANTFFCAAVGGKRSLTGRRQRIMARLRRAGSMLSRGKWSMRRGAAAQLRDGDRFGGLVEGTGSSAAQS